MAKKKAIDKVTVSRLDMCFKMANIQMPLSLIDKIIDIVELIEDKGGKTSLKDMSKLIDEWKN